MRLKYAYGTLNNLNAIDLFTQHVLIVHDVAMSTTPELIVSLVSEIWLATGKTHTLTQTDNQGRLRILNVFKLDLDSYLLSR